MLERPAPETLLPQELTVERVRLARGQFVLLVSDEQAAQIAPYFEAHPACAVRGAAGA